MKKCNFLLIVISVLFISCGGGNDESSSTPTPVVTSVPAPTVTSVPVPEVNPEISIAYPNSKSIIAAGEVIHARGSFSGGTSSNLQISLHAGGETVNAVLNDTDNTWSVAELPTEYGALGVEISATITNITTMVNVSDTVSLESKVIANAVGLFFDEGNNRLIYSDFSHNIIAELDLTTNESSIISSNTIGSGDDFTDLRQLDVNLEANKAYVVDLGENIGSAIIEVDLSSGDKRTLFNLEDELYQSLRGLVYSSSHDMIYVTNQADSTIFSIDLVSGNRGEVSVLTLGGEVEEYCNPEMLTLNNDNTILYFICNNSSDFIMSMDILTGKTNVISGELTVSGIDSIIGVGPDFSRLRNIKYNESNHTLSVTDDEKDGIFIVDIATGNRDFIMPLKNGKGDRLFLPAGLQFGAVPGEYFIADNTAGIVRVVGDSWETLDDSTVGLGPIMGGSRDLLFSSSDSVFYAIDSSEHRIFSINPLTGDRTLFGSTLLDGENRDDVRIASSILEGSDNLIFMLDSRKDSIYFYDLETKVRATISGGYTGNGIAFIRIEHFVIDPEKIRLWVSDSSRDAIIGVEFSVGDREVLVDSGVAEQEIVTPGAMMIENEAIIVFDTSNNTLFSVDRFTGAQSKLLDDTEALKFESPIRIIADSNRSRYLVTDIAKKELFAVSYSSPRIVTSISNNNDHEGIEFMFPVGMYLDEENNRVLVSDTTLDGIISVDLTTGNRTLFSR